MIIKSAQRIFILLTQKNVSKFYSGVRKYLPKERLKDFENAWGLNNLIKGPRLRKKLGKKMGVEIPTHIDIAPTTKCNLKCRGCYSSSHKSETDMTVENFEKIIIEAKELGIFQIAVLGGEPFLRKDILPVLEKHKEMAIRLSTNGTLIDADILDFLKKSGHVFLFLSLEGLEEETDFWRGDGIFQKVQENMQLLKQEKILFGFSAVMHKKNIDILISEKFLDRMEDLGNRLGLFFPYGPTGESQYFDLVLEEKEKKKSLEKLESLEKKYSMLFKAEGYISTQKPSNYFLNQGCTVGLNINITPAGNVEPCNGIQFHTGNIFENSLMEILDTPFYKKIYSCAKNNESRCVIIHEAEQINKIIREHDAVGSTSTSFPNLDRYLEERAKKRKSN